MFRSRFTKSFIVLCIFLSLQIQAGDKNRFLGDQEKKIKKHSFIDQSDLSYFAKIAIVGKEKLTETRDVILNSGTFLKEKIEQYKKNDELYDEQILLIDGFITEDQRIKKKRALQIEQESLLGIHAYEAVECDDSATYWSGNDSDTMEYLSGDTDEAYVDATMITDVYEDEDVIAITVTEVETETEDAGWDEYYQQQAADEEEAAQRAQDDADAYAYYDDQAHLREEERQEEIRQEALLVKHGYVFEISKQVTEELQRLQQEQSKPDDRGLLTRMLYIRPEILAEQAMMHKIAQEKESWRIKALEQAELKEKELEKIKPDKAVMPGGGRPFFQPDLGWNGFGGAGLPPDKDKDKYRNQFHCGMNPIFHQRPNGIKMAEFRQILGLKDKEPKTKEERIKEANAQKWADRQQREKAGKEKEKAAAQQRAILAASMQKVVDKALINPTSVKAKSLKKAQAVVQADRQRSLNDAKADLLPRGPGGYQGKLTSNFTMPRDKDGGFIDRNNDRFRWDEKVEKWRKEDNKGKFICYVDPLKTAEDIAQEKQRQEDFVQAQKITAAAVQESLRQFEELQKQAEEKNKQSEKDNGKKDPKNPVPQGSVPPCNPGETNPQLPNPVDVQTDFDAQEEFVDIVDACYVYFSKQDLHDQLICEQQEWLEQHNVANASQAEQNIISDLQNAMIDSFDSLAVEFAQAGLQAWVNAQDAQTDEEYQYHKDQAQKFHDAVVNKNPEQSNTQHIESVQSAQVNQLIENYTAGRAPDVQNKPNTVTLPNSGDKKPELEYEQRVATRLQALVESQKQIDSGQLIFQSHDISPQARGFMMANNINYTVFHPTTATSIQHALIQELIGVVEQSAVIGLSFNPDSIAAKVAHHTCNLAVAGQQLNEASQIDQAVAIADLSHFFALYGKYVLNNEAQGKALYEVSAGVYDGTTQVLQKWATFFKELCLQPEQTMNTIATDCTATGVALLNLAVTMNEFSPLEYVKDIAKDMRESVDRAMAGQPHQTAKEQTAVGQRTARNAKTLQDGLFQSLQAAQAIIQTMQEQSIRKNVADATQIYVQGVITGKIVENLAHVSALVGNELIQAGKAIGEVVPPHLMNSPFQTVTNAGQIALVADGTGESIGAAIAAAGKELSDPRFAKVVGQGAGGARKAQETQGGNTGKPQSGTSDSYTYEHGKTHPSAKHHPNSRDGAGKPPRDAQEALDNSFKVEKSTQRIAVQDDKVVVLKKTGEDLYHGYVVEDLNTLSQNVRDALVDNGFLKNATSKKLIKK
jgi:hypothetical protein